MAANVLFALVLVASLYLGGHAASYNLTISQNYVRVNSKHNDIRITCTAGIPLTGCQYRWWNGSSGQAGPLLELSRGPISQANGSHLNGRITSYSYSGRGLAKGDCGVKLQVKYSKEWMVSCRVRTEKGGWKYAWTDLYADITDPIQHTLKPREAVVLPGGEARFMLKTQRKLDQCRFYPPGAYDGVVLFHQGPSFDNSTGRHLSHGAGLNNGECGLTLTNVSEADNGPVRGYIRQDRRQDVRFLPLIVAHAPSEVTLRVSQEGIAVSATCEVTTSRPLANITWLFDDVVIRRDPVDDSHREPQAEWRWPWVQGPLKQRLVFTLQPEFTGKVLTCQVSHVALLQPLVASERIWITVAAPYNLTISPDYVQVSDSPNNISIICTADIAITGCQFRWWDYQKRGPGPLLELSQWPNTYDYNDHINTNLTSYSYSGRGLGEGVCGVSMQVQGGKEWIVACRVRTKSGGWRYAWTDLTASFQEHLPHTLSPREAVVLPGGEVRFMLKAQTALRWCKFYLPSGEFHFQYGPASRESTGRHLYSGAGLSSGECGLALANVSEADNGPVRGSMGKINSIAHRFMALITAYPPSKVTLHVSREGATVTAICQVTTSRPRADISWLLGDDIIRRDSVDDFHRDRQAEWRWPWVEGSVKQRVVFTVDPEFTVRVLTCLASHVALAQPLGASEGISYTAHCPPVISKTSVTACYFEGKLTNCSRAQPRGSHVNVTCKPGFVAIDGIDHRRITCLDTDEWDHTVTCIPDCGRRNTNSGVEQISHGTPAKVNEFPWHVAIYRLGGNSSPSQICGGSLLSPGVVISAAHCFWNNLADTKANATYLVAAGKHRREWMDDKDGDYVQRREVELVTTHPLYRGRNSNLQSDIALLKLSEEVDISPNVNLVCVDWEGSRSLVGNIGVFAGWGYTEEDRLSDSLRQVELPLVDRDTCYRALEADAKPLLTPDKMCAGYVGIGVSTCRGDSGGGLVNLNHSSNRYYLSGVLSIAFKPASSNDLCYAQFYTAFTIVSKYYGWIRVNL